MEISAYCFSGSRRTGFRPCRLKAKVNDLTISIENPTEIISIPVDRVLGKELTRQEVEAKLTQHNLPIGGMLDAVEDITWTERFIFIEFDSLQKASTEVIMLKISGHSANMRTDDLISALSSRYA